MVHERGLVPLAPLCPALVTLGRVSWGPGQKHCPHGFTGQELDCFDSMVLNLGVFASGAHVWKQFWG